MGLKIKMRRRKIDPKVTTQIVCDLMWPKYIQIYFKNNFIRQIYKENVAPQMDPETAPHVLCEFTQPKCTWQWILRKFIGKRSQTKTAPQVLREPAQSNYIWTRHNILYAEICKQHTAPETGAAHFVRACAIVWSHRVNFVLLLPPHIDVNSQTRCHPVVYEMINLFLYDFNFNIFF